MNKSLRGHNCSPHGLNETVDKKRLMQPALPQFKNYSSKKYEAAFYDGRAFLCSLSMKENRSFQAKSVQGTGGTLSPSAEAAGEKVPADSMCICPV